MASLVFLEGSIGAGKSTVLFRLEKKDIPSFNLNLWLLGRASS
jgi:dephospho-CoA kinase